MLTQARLVLIIVLLIAAGARVSCNLSNLEGIYELKLVSKWAQYLHEHQVKDQDGNLLQDNYFVDSNGVSHSSELFDDTEDTFEDLKKLVGWQSGWDGTINATALRYEPNITDNSCTKVWARIARDMMRAIDAAKLEDNGSEFLSQFKRHVFNPWQDVIYARYNSILRVDRQDALHLAILKAHQDYYVLVCQRMRERLPPEMEKFLPKLAHWQNPHERIQLDHIKWELKALRKYYELRKSLESELTPEELDSVIEVPPVSIRDAAYGFEVDPHLVSLMEDIGAEREIRLEYLVKMDESGIIVENKGSKVRVEDDTSRSLWRAIHRGLRVLGRHIIQAIEPGDIKRSDQSNLDALRVILSSLKEAVLQRVSALNGMMDNKIDQNLIMNFRSQRDNLNQLFDQLTDDLSPEKRSIWFELLSPLDLVKERGDGAINRFHLRVERDSLRTDAEKLFSSAIDHFAGVSPELEQASEVLRSVALEAINNYQGDEIRRRLMQAFDGLKQQSLKLDAPGGEAQEAPSHGAKKRDKLREARRQASGILKDFNTYIAAYAIRTGDQRLPVLVADVIENCRGLV